MKRIAILVTHLLGSGHLSRALTLARALQDAGLASQVISGGMPAAHLDARGIDLVQLPPVRSDGARFTRLLDASGEPVGAELLESRKLAIVEALQRFEPHVLITELFPFGRRVLRDEFEAALIAAQGLAPKPLVFVSVRDILAPPSSARKAAETEAWLQRFYDGVLVHSDPRVLPLDASWPVTPAIAGMLRYTGFIAAPDLPGSANGSDGAGEILVTAGGGPVGRKLFETAIEAARLGTRRWRLLVGGVDAVAVCIRLNDQASGAPALAEPARADYRDMLTRCAAAVGQCGYNTAIDWLQAGVAGVFVPFAEAGEVEQTLRAASLQERYGYGVIAEDELTPQKLADAAATAVARGRFAVNGLRLDGAEQTSRMICEFLAAHA
jgi:predicted glycosyltransferase